MSSADPRGTQPPRQQPATGTKRLLERLAPVKLYLGVVLMFLAGAFLSPRGAGGANVFLDPGNLTDVLRQVSINGILAVGMTAVILIGGIDLSVGTVMAFGSTLCAMLLTQQGWHRGALFSVPAMCVVAMAVTVLLIRRLVSERRLPSRVGPPVTWVAGLAAAALTFLLARATIGDGFGIVGVVLATMCVGLVIGALNGVLVARGGLQPFIVTLAAMVAVLGVARLVAGQDQSVYPIYTGTNAPESFERLRESILGVPIPGLVFLVVVVVFTVLLQRTPFGRHVYALGGNEAAAHLSGIRVARVKTVVFALSGMLSCTAGVFYAAQYRQGKPDAGTGLELDAIAAVVIGGTNLMGGKGSVPGTLGGVLIFGLLSNLLQLKNIDSNTQLVLKGVIIVVAVLLQEADLRGLWLRATRASRSASPSGGLDS